MKAQQSKIAIPSSNGQLKIPGFYKYSVDERLRVLLERKALSEDDFRILSDRSHALRVDEADRAVENVIGVFGLPVGLGMNFVVNGKGYRVPMVVEEPSIIAGVSSAAKLIGEAGGFTATAEESLLIGQIQLVNIRHAAQVRSMIRRHSKEILALANSLHPQMVVRGGGAVDLEVHILAGASSGGDMVVLHLLVDSCDAMGANLVNTMCEGVAPLVEKITGGKVFLRILSNLTDRSMVRARAEIPLEHLEGKGFGGVQVRDGIILASQFAAADPYRAATHNKGVMNGVDAVAIATGNDWRAIEAAAHAFAGRGKSYTGLTRWSAGDNGALVGDIEIPLKVGIVGGQIQSNRSVALNLRLLGVNSAKELAEVMAAVGLAQNFAALRALSTEGIQRGHMTLHARSVAIAAGATPDMFDTVVDKLVAAGEIKVWKAQEIIKEVSQPAAVATNIATEGQKLDSTFGMERPSTADYHSGFGKIILLGEHAAVYGSRALAAPVPLAIQSRIKPQANGGTHDHRVHVVVPRWGLEKHLPSQGSDGDLLERVLDLILTRLELRDQAMQIEVYPHIPRAMGLGGSAAMSVSVIRAASAAYQLGLSDEEVNALAFDCEKITHGTPSGIDNTLATYGKFILYQREGVGSGEEKEKELGNEGIYPTEMPKIPVPHIEDVTLAQPLSLVIGLSGIESLTSKMVAKVRASWENNRSLYQLIFHQIDGLTQTAVKAVREGDLNQLGEMMNICQGLLNALGVSSWELEELIGIARNNGAVGAKLTGGGGGGSIIALCPNDGQETANNVAAAIRKAGYRALVTTIGAAKAPEASAQENSHTSSTGTGGEEQHA